MNCIENPNIWEVDVDDTLVCWDLSKYPEHPRVVVQGPCGPTELVVHRKNVNMVIKLAKVGWFIRVHSGSGMPWARLIVQSLELEPFVQECCAKPRGRTDDRPPGDGLAYQAFRDLSTGAED
jgi:hypothetical protein